MSTRTITHTAVALSLAALSGCYSPQPLSVGAPALLPDGHSTLALASGSVCTTDCWHGVTVAGVVRSHWVNGTYVSEPQDFRPTSTPAPGLDLANLIVPAAIGAAGFVGGSVLESHAIMQAGAWQGEGAAAAGKAIGHGVASGDKALGAGVASAKPPVATSTTVNNNMFANTNSQNAVSSLSNTNTLRNNNNLTANSHSTSSSNATAKSGAFQFQLQ